MIFVTVGTQLPFDRLVRAVDEIAPLSDEEIFAQTNGGTYMPRNIRCADCLSADEFDEMFRRARLIVSHAGMGTILTALAYRKPVVVMPRFAFLGEHRSEHQYATAVRMNEMRCVHAAYDSSQLRNLILDEDIRPLRDLGDMASDNLIRSLKDFISGRD